MNSQHFLSLHIKHFFTDYLQNQRGVSKHTIKSYRDTFKILLDFLSVKLGGEFLANFTIFDLNPKLILLFLNYLENQQCGRSNKPQTRNLRLAAIHSFCRYLSLMNQAYTGYTNRILSIPIKKTTTQLPVDYFEKKELELLLNQINITTKDGFRDYCILYLAYNTGARAQEISELKLSSLSLDPYKQIKIVGKGNKIGIIPIWESTARMLNTYIRKYRRKPKPEFGDYLFINQRGKPFNRFSLRKVMDKYLQKAILKNPDLKKKRLSFHSLRHTTAVHMLESGVELNLIKSWLRHSDINTTFRYLEVNLDRKREVLNKFVSLNYVNCFLDQKYQLKRQKEDIYHWLDSL